MTREQIVAGEVYRVYDSSLGDFRSDKIDEFAKDHDLAYFDAKGDSDYWQQIKAADQILVDKLRAVLSADSLPDGGKLTDGERNYGIAMLELFEMKLKYIDQYGALIEYLGQSGYSLSQINDMITNVVSLVAFYPNPLAPAAMLFDSFVSVFTTASTTAQRRDPLILDLDNDGAETIGVDAGAFFDHDANGFAEQTGWVSPDDGLLVRDINGNGTIDTGRELFGDNTLLKDGTLATDGLQALADLDDNADGKIDSQDAAFSQLKVWKDTNSDGISTADELKTLSDLGIKSLNTTYTVTNITDSTGNIQTHQATYETTDGSIQLMGNFLVQRDTAYTKPTETLPVPEGDISLLPDLQGYGNVYDLQQAMIRDESGQLKALVAKFIETTNAADRTLLMDQILFKWTGSEGIDPASRGGAVDARILGVLEKFFGQTYTGTTGSNPHVQAIPFLSQSYKGLYEMFYSQIMAQTHLKDLYGAISYTWDDATQSVKGDLSAVTTEIQNQLAVNPETAKQTLGEFARTIRGFGAQEMMNYSEFRETLAAQDPELGRIIDTSGKNAITGTAGNDTIFSATDADAIDGGDGNDYLSSNAGDDVLYGGSGYDKLFAGEGNDVLEGGAGNDHMEGATGNDVYRFGRGSGADNIYDYDTTTGNVDAIEMASDIKPEDIVVKREGNALMLEIKGTTDKLQVEYFFKPESTYKIEEIQFADGTVWDVATVREMARFVNGTESAETLYGYEDNDVMNGLGGNDSLNGGDNNDIIDGGAGNDTLSGGKGDDVLYGGSGYDKLFAGEGNDVLEGGAGNDHMEGATGNDVYRFGRGSGADNIYDNDTTVGNIDVIEMASDIKPEDITVTRDYQNLYLNIKGTTDKLQVEYFFKPESTYKIEEIRFADGTVWDVNQITSIANNTSPTGAVTISGEAEQGKTLTAVTGTLADADGLGEFSYKWQASADGTSWTDIAGETGSSFTLTQSQVGQQIRSTVSYTDGHGTKETVTSAATGAIANVNDAPIINNPIEDTSATEDTTFSYVIPADTFTDIDAGDTLAYTATQADGTALPNWLNFDAETMTFGGTPTNDSVGTLSIKITATDASGATANSVFDLNIANMNDAPEVNRPIEDVSVNEDSLFSYTLPADAFKDIDTGDTLTCTATLSDGSALPDWLTFDAETRTFSGTPTNDNVGSISIKVTATDGSGASISDVFDMAIANINDAPVINNPIENTSATEDSAFSYVIPADTFSDIDAGDTLTYTATKADGSSLPDWLNFDAETMTFSGMPTGDEVGTLSVKLTATDGSNESASTVFDITIKNIIGTDGDDNLYGGASNNKLYGLEGNDALTGGTGNDELIGGQGNDTYVFNLGDGVDTIQDVSTDTEGNLIVFGEGITRDDLKLAIGNGQEAIGILTIQIGTGGDAIRVLNFDADNPNIRTIEFSDGTQIALKDLLDPGTEGDDIINTGASDDVIKAKGGNDIVNTNGGNDTIIGGTGNDILNGGEGDDTYIYNLGDGLDSISDASGTDMLRMGQGIDFDHTIIRIEQGVAHLRLLDAEGSETLEGMNITLNPDGTIPLETIAFADGSS
ncbi:MAG: putative Ig domain-containing protein, partial [Nitrospirae bacterium]|nr:putative Ig domain-containing protein [Nitrospirota bacterium]MCL5977279.1 putative Ig domain-containing protein [Nitrospirota bacterium]